MGSSIQITTHEPPTGELLRKQALIAKITNQSLFLGKRLHTKTQSTGENKVWIAIDDRDPEYHCGTPMKGQQVTASKPIQKAFNNAISFQDIHSPIDSRTWQMVK